MSEQLNGAELFERLMLPEATVGEIAEMDLETLAQKVRYRRKWKVRAAGISDALTDEQIAQAILDYARSVHLYSDVDSSAKAPLPAIARNEFLGWVLLTFMVIFLGIWGWVAYDRGQMWDLLAGFVQLFGPVWVLVLAALVLIGLARTARAFVRFRRVAGSAATRTLVKTGGLLLLVGILAAVLLMRL